MTCELIESSNAAAKAVAPGTDLPKAARAALFAALDDEHHAEASYEAIIAAHGEVPPFANIVKAERRHAAAIATMMKAYGIAVPKNAWKTGEKALEALPADIPTACAAGVEAEEANVRLYDQALIPAVADFPGLVDLFQRLRDSSRDRHLPAFRRGAARGSGVPDLHARQNHGQGRGRGGCGGGGCQDHGHAQGHGLGHGLGLGHEKGH